MRWWTKQSGAVGLFLLGAAMPALAGPPPTGDLSDKAADALLMRLVQSTVAGVNCVDYETTDPEWKLIVDTSDQLANQLGLDNESYDARYYDPVFVAYDEDAAFCETLGPGIAPLIEEMIARGGSIDKYKPGG
jgi:hypothetical protein